MDTCVGMRCVGLLNLLLQHALVERLRRMQGGQGTRKRQLLEANLGTRKKAIASLDICCLRLQRLQRLQRKLKNESGTRKKARASQDI